MSPGAESPYLKGLVAARSRAAGTDSRAGMGGAGHPVSPPTVMILSAAQETMPVQAVEALLGVVTKLGPGSGVFFSQGSAAVVAKRNGLVEGLLTQTTAPWAFFLDTDMCPAPDVLSRLVAHGKDIVGALAFARSGSPDPNAGWHPPQGPKVGRADCEGKLVEPQRGLVKVDWIGAAAMLVRRRVFERLPAPWFLLPPNGLASDRGEDQGFCWRAQAAGFEIYCDTDTIVDHLSAPHPVGLADYRAAFPGRIT